MAAALTLALAASACVPSAPGKPAPGVAVPLRVANGGAAFAFDQGATARKLAEAECARQGKRLRPTIYDRFDAGAWVFEGGCA